MMLGSSCSPCCGDDCKGCKSAAWGAARKFAQSLASLNGTSYTGLSIDGQVQDSVFAVQSSAAVATFEGSSVFPPVPGVGNGKNRAQASLVSDSKGCVSGRATVTVPLDGLFFGAEKGTRYYKTPFEVRVSFNMGFGSAVHESLSPSIFIEQSIIGFQFWQGIISRPLITGVRFGGESVSGMPWDGVSEPTINNAIPLNWLHIFPSNNCKWRGSSVDERAVLEVPVGNYGGPIEIDLTIFTQEYVIDEDGDTYPTYSVLSTGTVTVQWDDMTEFEVDEDCNSGACCNGTTCSVKPQCQCNAAAGEVFKGVGTVCSPNPCLLCAGECEFGLPRSYPVTISEYANELPFVCFEVNRTLPASLYANPFTNAVVCYLWYALYPFADRVACHYDCGYNPGPAGAGTNCNSLTVDMRQPVAGGRTAILRLVLGGRRSGFIDSWWTYNGSVFVPCNAAGCPVFPVVIDELLQPEATGQNWPGTPPTSPIRVSMTIPDPAPNPLP